MPWSKRNAWIIALFTMIRGFLRRLHAVDTEWHVIWLNCQLSEENTENYVCANKINIIGQCFNLALDWTAVLFIIIITNNWQVVNVFNSLNEILKTHKNLHCHLSRHTSSISTLEQIFDFAPISCWTFATDGWPSGQTHTLIISYFCNLPNKLCCFVYLLFLLLLVSITKAID